MKLSTFLWAVFCIICASHLLYAQNFSGFVSSTIPGIAASSYQPANLFVKGSGLDITLLNFHTSYQSNVLKISAINKKVSWNYQGQGPGFIEVQSHLQLPSIGFPVGKKSTLGFGLGIHHFAQATFSHHISKDLMSAPLEEPALPRLDQEAKVLVNSWYALEVSYARLIAENNKGLFKIGITGQLLWGNGGLSTRAVLPEYKVPSYHALDINRFFFSHFTSDNVENYKQLRWLWHPEQHGGLGFNSKLGVKWERSDKTRMRQRGVKLDNIGLAVIDLGSISYRANQYNFLTFEEKGNSNIDLEAAFGKTKEWKSLRDTINRFSPIVSSDNPWTMVFPATFYFEVNFLLSRNFRLNGSLLKSLPILQENSLSRLSECTLTLYYYTENFSLGLPVSLNQYGKGHVGIAFYRKPLMVGINYMESYFFGSTFRNFGLSVILLKPVGKKEKRKSIEFCRY